MAVVYLLGTLFLSWLALSIYRAWRLIREEYRVARAVQVDYESIPGASKDMCERFDYDTLSQKSALLIQDQADYAEGFVRQLAAKLNRYPALRAVLVDGGSSDDTALILERLARCLNMQFCCLVDLGSGCVRKQSNLSVGDFYPSCEAECFSGEKNDKPIRCLDLRGISGKDLLKFNLFDTINDELAKVKY